MQTNPPSISPRLLKLLAAATGLLLLFGTRLIAAQEAAPEGSWIHGPATVTLGDDLAQLVVEEGYLFADAKTTRQLLKTMGNPPSGQEMGLIAPASEEKSWFVVFEHAPVGFVKDDDQDKIDAGALLASIREATEAANEERREMGVEELHVTDWSEPPHYDQASHNLIWALAAVDDRGGQIVNYNVRLLGRKGYMSVTLVTEPGQLAQTKPAVERVLANFSYKPGNRYAEYVAGDKLAGYGLAALVAGGAGAAAAKLGLFAVIGKFLAKGWKLIVVAVVGLGAALRRLLGGRKTATSMGH